MPLEWETIADAEILAGIVHEMRVALREVTTSSFDMAPRATVHSLIEAAGQAAVDLMEQHPEMQREVFAKLDELRLYVMTAGQRPQ